MADDPENGWSSGYTERVWLRIQRNVLPVIGPMPMNDIDGGHILDVIRPVEKRGTIEMAFKCHAYCSSIFRYAVANRRADRNPCADFRPSDAAGTMPKRTHFAAKSDMESFSLTDIASSKKDIVLRPVSERSKAITEYRLYHAHDAARDPSRVHCFSGAGV